MDKEWQEAIWLLNLLFTAILAINEVKIVLNTRSANIDNTIFSKIFPKNVIYASGFLGCKNQKVEHNFDYVSKILSILPSSLLIYGKHDKIVENQLATLNINFINYKDFHVYSKEVA